MEKKPSPCNDEQHDDHTEQKLMRSDQKFSPYLHGIFLYFRTNKALQMHKEQILYDQLFL